MRCQIQTFMNKVQNFYSSYRVKYLLTCFVFELKLKCQIQRKFTEIKVTYPSLELFF